MTKTIKTYATLHGIILLYSLSGVCSKTAAGYPFLSLPCIFFYGMTLCILFIYAVLWQQVLGRLPLTTAFTNKAITVLWGMIWGVLFFNEQIDWNMILGAGLVLCGVWIVVGKSE